LLIDIPYKDSIVNLRVNDSTNKFKRVK